IFGRFVLGRIILRGWVDRWLRFRRQFAARSTTQFVARRFFGRRFVRRGLLGRSLADRSLLGWRLARQCFLARRFPNRRLLARSFLQRQLSIAGAGSGLATTRLARRGRRSHRRIEVPDN